jgi:signal transduction histidine kinase
MDSGHRFQIVDTGIGIAPEDIPKALSRFGQIDGDLNRRYDGTGLGLPLAKALVELHGGVLDLQSEVGVGTTVTVRFPVERIVASLDNQDSLDVEDRADWNPLCELRT